MSPEWIEVDSSAIDAVAYEDGELFVAWKGSGTYVYSIVPEHKFEEMMHADSIGGYVNREIKPYYDHRKL
jgi:KTSC domain